VQNFIWPNTTTETSHVKSIRTPMTWYEEKTDLKRAWRFYVQKNSPLKSLFGGTVYKSCMQCMFRCADTILLWKWLKMDVEKSKIVWSGNNVCHMSQENVIKFRVASHPWFLDSYSVLGFLSRYPCFRTSGHALYSGPKSSLTVTHFSSGPKSSVVIFSDLCKIR